MNKNNIIILIVLLIVSIGILPTFKLIFEVFVMMDDAVFQLLNESILGVVFKHRITYYIVGLMLSSFTVFTGYKLRSNTSKILYFVVAIGVGGILNFVAMIIRLII